ncbi:MAG TPA: hypothetical protein VG756_20740 [Pseudonocardiaceae bacterium]|nr:hypothetical protein [Pseudonocardiaceae bacterium]
MATVSGHAGSGRIGTAMWRIPRTRGATSGTLLVLLGIWGGLVPFVGPHFGYAYTPGTTWTMTSGRLFLEVLPGAAAVLGGLIMLSSTNRAVAVWASWLAAVGGAWFVVGPSLSRLWTHGQPQSGTPTATTTLGTTVQEIGFFYGTGVVILFLAAAGLGRLSVVGVRDAQAATAAAAEAETARGSVGGTALADQPTTYQTPAYGSGSAGSAGETTGADRTTQLPRHQAAESGETGEPKSGAGSANGG